MTGDAGSAESWPLIAYSTCAARGFVPEPATKIRAWIEATPNKFARRCLPLVVANQAGWMVRTPFGFRARWDGAMERGSVAIVVDDPTHPGRSLLSDHFGAGIITFNIPYLFRTPPGIELLVRGAPNFWVEGAHPLEGLVETDWATASFTMNWRLTSPGRWVQFNSGDPICFLQPISIATTEAARPAIVALAEDPQVEAAFLEWSMARKAFNADPGRGPEGWQKDYFLGKNTTGAPAATHRTRVQVAHFAQPPLGERTPSPAPEEFPQSGPAIPAAPGEVIAATTSRSGPRTSGLAVEPRWQVHDDFYDDAPALRAAVTTHLAGTDTQAGASGVWQLFHVEGLYAYLRTPAPRIIPAELMAPYRAALSAWGWANLGMGRCTDPYLSLYLAGCGQGLHNDAATRAHAYVHSLSPSSGFTGGATMLLRTDPYWGTPRTGRAQAGTSFVEKVEPAFNRLLVFDSRLIHGVDTVQGSWNPNHARLVLQGQFQPGGLHLSGDLDRAAALATLTQLGSRLAGQVPELEESVRAAIGVRLDVAADGRVSDVSVLSTWTAPLSHEGIPDDLIERIVATLRSTVFADGPGSATFSVPPQALTDPAGNPAVRYRKLADFDFEERADGLLVLRLGEVERRLNHSAMFILECCTEGADAAEIAELVRTSFDLEDAPHDLVRQCLRDLVEAGLIATVEDAPQSPVPADPARARVL